MEEYLYWLSRVQDKLIRPNGLANYPVLLKKYKYIPVRLKKNGYIYYWSHIPIVNSTHYSATQQRLDQTSHYLLHVITRWDAAISYELT